jgi:subtilisin family serine protease
MDKRLHAFRKSLCVLSTLAFAAPALAAAAPDPMLPNQWALADPGAVGAAEAWTQSTGAGVLVAVLDSGLQLDHPDLAANVWTNPGEVAGNGIDDDRDGVVDDVHGANMFDLSANVDDDNGHGTHVAGIVAARHGNGTGGSGLAPNAKILPVKVLDSDMSGTTETLAMGIRYAVDRGAKILNVSVNTDAATETVKSAVRYAGEHGAIVVASAGNNGRDIDRSPSFPASLADPAVFSVGAVNPDGLLWSLSNTGLQSVDIAAPGDHIVSTARASAYQSRTGTSAAAPFVSATLALLSSARPDLPMSELRAAISATTHNTSALSAVLGGGRLDAGAAMHRVLAGRPWTTAPVATTASTGPSTLRLRTASRVRAKRRSTLRWSMTGAAAITSWRVSLDGKVVARLPAGTAGVSRRISRVGRHNWRVVGFNAAGAKLLAAKRAFRVVRSH